MLSLILAILCEGLMVIDGLSVSSMRVKLAMMSYIDLSSRTKQFEDAGHLECSRCGVACFQACRRRERATPNRELPAALFPVLLLAQPEADSWNIGVRHRHGLALCSHTAATSKQTEFE
jgi:hypothetical protein